MARFPVPTVLEIHRPKTFTGNSTSITALLSSCSTLSHLLQIHAQIITSGRHGNSHLTDKIIHLCTSNSLRAKHPLHPINHGCHLASLSENQEPFSWNNVIRALATSKLGREALRAFLRMRRQGIGPNEHTFPFIFKACSSFSGLDEGRQVHGDVVKHGLHLNVYVQNTLIHMYGSCKKIVDAYKVFEGMPQRTVVSWNSVISALVECSWFDESIELFVKMRRNGVGPDETTMVIVLSACTELGSLNLGKRAHSQVIELGLLVNCQLGTSLVDMYAKCGNINYAARIFNAMARKNVWTWSSMIIGFAQHGLAGPALQLFHEMKNQSIRPNHVTFLGVLCACSHAGLVHDGRRYFHEMEKVHGLKPGMLQYGAMVDLLGRAGLLEEAYDFIMDMPVEPDGAVWRALLSACGIHDRVGGSAWVGEKVRRRLVELEPKRIGNLVMIANNYADVGSWEEAENLRRKMRDCGLKKVGGWSCLEIGGRVARFFSGDFSSVTCCVDDILSCLSRLSLHSRITRLQ
ncbi:Pentatricopeptide repeat-containing protein [Striga hermonthica]|uniref:Pentatricopeptide repeat-containing protein n=1 Tax=Striga hermonthica TaxID=68872 RepID=A0A9N7NGN3_STRHE|nr:Pentatricopeptide repeat-containing protein [Striga hermonthica]